MTYDECKELLATLMEAVVKQVDARLSGVVKSEVGIVRLIDGNNVYVRPSSDVSTPSYDSPTSTAQLDDGDIVMPNISGQTLEAGDGVEVMYTTTVDNAVIVRRVPYDDDKCIIYNDENGDTRIPATLRISDTLYINGHTSNVGAVLSSALSSDKSISSGSAINVTSLTLDAGTWIIVGRVRFSANADGYRRANILTVSDSPNAHIQIPAVDGAVTQIALSKIVSPATTTTYYLNAYQNSGSTLTLGAGGDGEINAMTAVRIA